MVSQTDVSSRLTKYGEQKLSDPGAVGQGNTVYCQTSPLYVDDKESAAATLVSLAQEARLATEDVKAPTSNAILTVCKSLIAGGTAGGVYVPPPQLLAGFSGIQSKTVGMDGSKRSLQIDDWFFAMQVTVCCWPLGVTEDPSAGAYFSLWPFWRSNLQQLGQENASQTRVRLQDKFMHL